MGAEKQKPARKQPPIACDLPMDGQRSRQEELSDDLFAGCETATELEDGYEFNFPGDAQWVERLANFVAAERECCRFFLFEIIFEPDLGPVILRMRGPEGTKDFLGENLTNELIAKLSSHAARP